MVILEAAVTNTAVASTILSQLGGTKITAMIGATNLVNLGDGLQFRFKGSRTANVVVVTLQADDTYKADFFKLGKVQYKRVEARSGLFAEDLRLVFEGVTGLRISL